MVSRGRWQHAKNGGALQVVAANAGTSDHEISFKAD
jgi:hypothetical protein